MDGALIAGIVNVTPDSFSDGGQFRDPAAAVAHALRLLDEGADWLDVGGESTRPGATAVSAEVEVARVEPVVRGIVAARPGVTVSVDTRRASVAEAACRAGASVVNDVSALADPAMPAVVARHEAQVVLMHMRGTPRTMQRDTAYADLLGEVIESLRERALVAQRAGIPQRDILLDPGVGFGKAPADNPALIAGLPRLAALGYRTFVGASRKRFIGQLTGVERAADRVFGSVGAALAAAAAGADVIRVHDVAATRQALTVFQACRAQR
ncbi:MAG: dihydropteroate synthase [Myxococcota bacterium]|jgi:dihydropteroate synthase